MPRLAWAWMAGTLALFIAGCRGCELPELKKDQDPLVNEDGVDWVMTEHGLATLDIDGDGRLDVVGLCATHSLGGPSEGPFSICAFDGVDFRLLWRVGEHARETFYATHIAAIGDKVFVVDPLGRAQVLSPKDGSEIAFTQLSDRAKEICAEADGAWIFTADGKGTRFRFEPPTGDPAERPRSCRQPVGGALQGCLLGRSVDVDVSLHCANMPFGEPIEGVMAARYAMKGRRGAVIGTHTPGTGYPVVVAFHVDEHDTVSIDWQRPLTDDAPLSDGTSQPVGPVVTERHIFIGHGDTIVALDPATGKTQWRQPTKSYMTLHADDQRVYVGRWSRLQIHDADTGKPFGGIGDR